MKLHQYANNIGFSTAVVKKKKGFSFTVEKLKKRSVANDAGGKTFLRDFDLKQDALVDYHGRMQNIFWGGSNVLMYSFVYCKKN